MIRKLQASRGSVAPTDVPTVRKILEALFPEGASRESYPSDVAPEVPLFQMSELKLAAKRPDSGTAPGSDGIPNEVLRAAIREKPQLIIQHVFGKRPFPETMETPKPSPYIEA